MKTQAFRDWLRTRRFSLDSRSTLDKGRLDASYAFLLQVVAPSLGVDLACH